MSLTTSPQKLTEKSTALTYLYNTNNTKSFINNDVQQRAENLVPGLAHGIGDALQSAGVEPYPLDRLCNYLYETGKSIYSQLSKVIWKDSVFSSENSDFVNEIAKMQDDTLKINAQVLYRLYHVIWNRIDNATKIARQNNKPLLILLGEAHENIDCAFKLSLIFRILADRKGFQGTFSEYFHPKSYSLRKKTFPPSLKVLDALTEENGLKIIPMDLARCEELSFFDRQVTEECNKISLAYLGITKSEDYLSAQFLERVKARNRIMMNEMIFNKGGDAIALVGAAHLRGLLKDHPDLSEHYEILPISMIDGELFKDDDDDNIRFLSSDELLLISEEIISIENDTAGDKVNCILQISEFIHQYCKKLSMQNGLETEDISHKKSNSRVALIK
ncbi:MAG: hypothetical protein BGO43_03770 [Gammaproteobacteria bacterium 39-13]|nr:hypothetical protein [Gammaproteobacteria bacterium]OJV96512.1 MAG: hypothetical protein BGO43_03770 [Gammaproteobacteria bacterium 39-13]